MRSLPLHQALPYPPPQVRSLADMQPLDRGQASMGRAGAGAGVGGGGGVAAQHLGGVPAGKAHEVGLVAAVGAPAMGEGVAEHVGMQALDTGLDAAPADDLGDATAGERASLAEPQRLQARVGVARANAEIAVEGLAGLVAERQSARSTALAGHMDHIEVMVDVLGSDLGELLQARTGVQEQGQDRGVAALVEAAALADL